jgi:TIR domain
MTDFFISYTSADQPWAEWIAWELEAAKYTTVIQAWDFRPGGDFVLEMHEAAAAAERTIAVLSPAYLQSGFAQPEWSAAFAADPQGWERKLVPVRVEVCDPGGLLRARIYIDLVGCDVLAARKKLLAGVSGSRAKPSRAPAFPGVRPEGISSIEEQPVFPGYGGQQPERYRPRVRREHTDRDRHAFLKEAFADIRARFDNGIRQLIRDHPHVRGEIEEHGAAKFTCLVYVDESLAHQCKIWLGSSREIGYVAGKFRLDDDNSYNESLHIANDPYELKLSAIGMAIFAAPSDFDIKMLTPGEAAEYLWRVFARSLER